MKGEPVLRGEEPRTARVSAGPRGETRVDRDLPPPARPRRA